jgi:serine/threonine protein kinase
MDEQALEDSVLFCPHCRAAYRSGFVRCPLDGAELRAEETDPLIGTTVGEQYTITRCIAYGATSRVYHAHHTRLRRRELAVKVLLGDLTATLPTRMRFAQEAEMLSRLDHPNVVSVVDFARTPEGLLYLVMDLADGPTLAELIRLTGPMPWRRAVVLAQQMCRGLSHAHSQDIVHRDFKPDNVIIEYAAGDELVRIIDFGIALTPRDNESPRLTNIGFSLGTPAYASPEQALNQTLDHRADLFALGVTLYEMLAGVLPFTGDARELLQHNAFHDAPDIGERNRHVKVPAELERVVRRLMARAPEARYQTAVDVLHALDEVVEEVAAASGPIRRPSVPPPAAPAALSTGKLSARPPATTPPGPRRSLSPASTPPPVTAAVATAAAPRAVSTVTAADAAPLGPVMERMQRGARPKWPRVLVGLAALSTAGYFAITRIGAEAPLASVGKTPKAIPAPSLAELDAANSAVAPATADAAPPEEIAEIIQVTKVPGPRARRPLDRRTPSNDGASQQPGDEAQGDKLVTAAQLGGGAAAATDGPASPARLDPQGGGPAPAGEGATAAPAGDAKVTLAVATPSDASAPVISTNSPASGGAPPITAVEPAPSSPAAPAIAPAPSSPTAPAPAPANPPPAPAPSSPATPPAASAPAGAPPTKASTVMFLSGRELQVTGSLSSLTVERAVTRVARGLTACAKHATAKSAKARFVIDERGRATSIAVDGATPELTTCVRASLSGLRTETPPDVGTVEATLTLFFTPKAAS